MIKTSLICNNISPNGNKKNSISNNWQVTNVIILFTLMAKSHSIGDTKMTAYSSQNVSSLAFTKHRLIVVWLHCSVWHDIVTWPLVEMSHGITPYLNPVGV